MCVPRLTQGPTPTALPNHLASRIFNLGNTHPHTVTELVGLLEAHLGRLANKKHIPLPPTGDVLSTYADISRAQQVRQPRLREALGGAPGLVALHSTCAVVPKCVVSPGALQRA